MACGAFVAWVTAVWITMTRLTLDWPGPVAPVSCVDQGDVGCAMARVFSVEAFGGPLTILVVLAGAAWSGVRFAARRAPGATVASDPAAPAVRVPRSTTTSDLAARVLIGGATVVVLAGFATLVLLAWADALGGPAWAELASPPFLTLLVAAVVAWTASGSGRGTVVLALVAAVLLARPVDPPVPLAALAVLLGITSVLLASSHRPVAAMLRRMSS